MTPEQMREGKVKPGFKYVGTHVIFDIKMGGKFTCKARLVAGRNITAPPSLYGMKSSGEACRNKLSKILNSMGYRSADYYHGYWIKRATTENGATYYKYMLVYVDDLLHLAKDSQENMLKLNQVY